MSVGLPQFLLTDQVALITGATGFLGSAMAAALAQAGASVVVTSRRQEQAEKLATSLPSPAGARHHGVVLDHMDEESLQAGFERAVQLAGKVDVLVNNGNEHLTSDWTSVTAEQFNRQLQNVTGYFLLSRLFRNHVVARSGQGSLILIGSMYGLVGSYPDAYEGVTFASPVAYHALKGGLSQMTRHLAVYWAKDGVRVNCLCPGPFPGPAAPAGMVARLSEKCPMGRMGQPEELQGPVVYLASQASSYMTGQNLVIDGGWTAW